MVSTSDIQPKLLGGPEFELSRRFILIKVIEGGCPACDKDGKLCQMWSQNKNVKQIQLFRSPKVNVTFDYLTMNSYIFLITNMRLRRTADACSGCD